uniref:SERTA domain-containing protein 2-like n=1 Tax=Cyprinodon variegatus TaxID=28743 RepID=A0A3Q2D0A4_CYPVA
MILKGQKRKLDLEDVEVSDPRSPMWESQRQFVFSVSLNKYQRSQELPEPSLRRSVLIANTLRQITLEKSGLACEDRDEERPSSDPSSRLVAIERENSDFSLSAAISSILTALDSTIDGSTQAAQRTPLRSLENISGPSERGSAGLKQGTRAGGASWEQQGEEKAQENSAEAAKSSYLNDVTMEDLFQDVEASLLERDMGGTGIRSSRVGYPAEEELICYLPPFSPSSPHPFSLSLNSNLKCLPSFSSFSPLPSPPSPESASFSTQNQAREGFELEHLMEILVES